VLNQGHTKTVVGVADAAHMPELGRTRLARELFRGRFRPRQSVQLREVAAEYQLDHESVLKTFAEFQALGMVTLSGNLSATVRSQDPQETQEAYQIRSTIEEIAGRTAASVLRGYTTELRNQLSLWRGGGTAVAESCGSVSGISQPKRIGLKISRRTCGESRTSRRASGVAPFCPYLSGRTRSCTLAKGAGVGKREDRGGVAYR